jgi:hypothetical protein
MLLRTGLLLAMLLGPSASSQSTAESMAAPPWQSPLVSFHETDFDMTYSYPQRFVPADATVPAPTTFAMPKSKPADPPCAQAPLSVGYTDGGGNSVFVVSIIDDACPSVLADAEKLGPFTHAQVLRQLQRYGVPMLTHEATLFSVDGRPAAVSMASAHATETQKGDVLTTTYAAKVCLYAERPNGAKHAPIVCFDFTTQQRDLLPAMLAFPIHFGDHAPHPLVPVSVLR